MDKNQSISSKPNEYTRITRSLTCSTRHLSHQLSARDKRLATMICLMCSSYLISVLPKVALEIATRGQKTFPSLAALTDTVFMMQFTGNFVIYAASNKQYREEQRTLFTARNCCYRLSTLWLIRLAAKGSHVGWVVRKPNPSAHSIEKLDILTSYRLM